MSGGAFTQTLLIGGAFDAAVDPVSGQTYFVAAPGGDSGVYRYDFASSGAQRVIDLGGFSGGLAFDAEGGLYYASQLTGEVVRFDAAALAAAGAADPLTMADADTVAAVFAGGIAVDDGLLFATTGFGNALEVFDLSSGLPVTTLATDVDMGFGIGKLGFSGDKLLVTYTDYAGGSSTIYAVTVPEPAIALTPLAGTMLLRRRRPAKA